MKQLAAKSNHKIVPSGSVLDYLKPMKWLKLNPIPLVLLIGMAALLESALMGALYPVISIGLNEKQALSGWFEFLGKLGLNETKIVFLHLSAFVLFGVSCSVARWGGEAKLESFRGTFEQSARRALAHSLQKMNWGSYISLGSGQSIHLLATSSDKMSGGAHSFLYFLCSLIFAVMMLFALTIVSPAFTAATIVLFFVGFIFQKKLSNVIKKSTESYASESATLGGGYSFLMQNLKYFRSSGFSEAFTEKMDKSNENSADFYRKTHGAFAVQRILIDLCAFTAIASVLFTVIAFHPITFSKASVFLGLLYRLIPKIVAINLFFQSASINLPFLQLWCSAYKMATEAPRASDSKKEVDFTRSIEFRNVSFGYGDAHAPDILTNINFRIEKNSFLAITGASGSGKSTIFDLMTGLLTPKSGSVTIDDVDLNSISVSHWRKQIGLVLQENPIIRGTVLENIAFMEENPDREWAEECARIANAHEFIHRMPDQMDTILDEKASLSGGEAQRLALARALYRRPNILILDEPTSALDMAAEEKFMRCLETLSGTMTIVMITHRLSSLTLANEVLVLSHGKVVNCGTIEDPGAEKLLGTKLIDPTKAVS